MWTLVLKDLRMALRPLRTIGFLAVLIASILFSPLQNGYEHGTKAPRELPLQAVSGPQRTIVILVRFSGTGNSTSPSQISTILTSMDDYHRENSYGIVSFLMETTPPASAPWYSMPNTMAYYGADSASSNTQLVQDALQAAYNEGVNLSSYTLAIVVHAGNDEAVTRVASDIHSYTIPGFVFRPAPLIQIPIPTSVVAESDPMGVYAHEAGHLLGLPDLYDTTQQIDPSNHFVGYWDLMGLGEWNPNTGNPLIQPGTYPSHMSAWSKIDLGFIPVSRIVTVQSGDSANVTLENIELLTGGFQVVKIPVAFNQDGSLTYYLVEMRAKQGTYDQHLPFPTTYPNAGLLVYKINETIPHGTGSVRLIDAHPGGDLNDAPFGPCGLPCVSNNTFWDQTNYVKVIITTTTLTAYTITVDRTDSPPFLLQVNTPSEGILVSVDGVNMTTDPSGQLRITVRYGPHTVYVEARIPLSLGSTSVQIGLANTFVGWDDGGSGNPRGMSIIRDTVLTAVYRITVEPSLTLAIVAVIALAIIVAALTLHRHVARRTPDIPPAPLEGTVSRTIPSATERAGSFPRNDSLSGESVDKDQQTEGTDS
jgi:M6 family metalloprotease-like protein